MHRRIDHQVDQKFRDALTDVLIETLDAADHLGESGSPGIARVEAVNVLLEYGDLNPPSSKALRPHEIDRMLRKKGKRLVVTVPIVVQTYTLHF
jgi:hypothetical protein